MHVFTFDRLGYMLLFLRVLALAACLCTWLHPLEEQTFLCSTCQSTGLMMTSMHISRRAAGKLRDEASCNHFLSTSTVMHDHEEWTFLMCFSWIWFLNLFQVWTDCFCKDSRGSSDQGAWSQQVPSLHGHALRISLAIWWISQSTSKLEASKGFGFCSYATTQAATMAIKGMNGPALNTSMLVFRF